MSTSITKNRLLHISDLPHIQRFSSNDINKLLPVHYSTLKDNILTMLHFESQNFFNKVLVHDPNLTITSTNYSQIRGGWCQDFDRGQEESSVQCIKKSIQIGVIILNYLQAMCQATVKHRDPLTQDDQKIIPKGQCLIKHWQPNSLQFYPQKLKDTLRRQNNRNPSQFELIPMQKQSQCFKNQNNLVIAYNIYKKNKKYIFLTGLNECYTDNFINLIQLFRRWNLGRLKIQKNLQLKYDTLFRANSYLQHLFSITRAFIFNSFRDKQPRDPFLPSSQMNDNKKHLKILLSYFEIGKELQKQSQLILSKFKQQQNQTFSLLEDTLRIYRFGFTYKLESESVEEKEGVMLKLGSYLCKVLGRVLVEIPININASYCFDCRHDEVLNQLFLLMAINYKSHLSKHIFLSGQQLQSVTRSVSTFLNKQYYQQVKKAERNVADQVFKNSYTIFNKYSQVVQNKIQTFKSELSSPHKVNLSRQNTTNNLMKINSSLSLSKSAYSRTPSHNKLTPQKNTFQTGKKLTSQKTLSQHSTIFSKSTRLSELELQYKKLLRSLQERTSIQCLINPIELKNILKHYLSPYQEHNKSNNLQKVQKMALKVLAVCCQILNPEDVHHLMLKYEDSMECLSDFFMQEGNFEKMVQVGKLMWVQVGEMFKSYLHLGRGFVPLRYNKVVCYLKRLIQRYHLKSDRSSSHLKNPYSDQGQLNPDSRYSPIKQSNPSYNNSPSKRPIPTQQQQTNYPQLNLRQLGIEQLIFLLQQKSASSPVYKNLLSQYMKDIFTPRQHSSFISSILYHFYIELVNKDHHQDLVAAFIADFYFELIYFTNQLTSITLNNSRYRKNAIDLKQKKFLQIIRDYGFFHSAFQTKNILIPLLVNTKPPILYQQLIVRNIRIHKPAYFRSVIKMIQNSYFSQSFTLLTKYIYKKSSHFQSLTQPISLPFYSLQIIQQATKLSQSIKTGKELQESNIKQEIQDPLVNIDISESGIFRDLVSLNPNMKIGGISLKQEYSRIIRMKQEEQKKFTVGHLLSKILKLDIDKHWEFIQLALQLKPKYIQTEKEGYRLSVNMDPERENQLLYLKQTLQFIYSRLSGMYEYLALNDVVWQIKLKTQLSV